MTEPAKNFRRIGIIGGSGWLGTAMAGALVRSNVVGADEIMCSYRSSIPANAPGCRWTRDNGELVASTDVVILSVRPADWPSVEVNASDKLVISVMAGVRLSDIGLRTGSSRLARALPNAAAELGFSYTPIYVESGDAADISTVRTIFEACGTVDVVANEVHIDYFTGMSGSGAAFPALLAESMMKDAIGRGIAPDIAVRAAQQIIIGAGRLQEVHRVSPAETVKAFVDYRGTTAAGIEAMRERGFEQLVSAGLEAAYRQALALSGDHKKDPV